MNKEIVKKIFKVLEIILWGLVCLLFIIVCWLLFDKFILKSPVPSMFGYATLTIETGSMNGVSIVVEGEDPAEINIGDLILIKKSKEYKIGDVITFLHEGETIPTTHRIIGYVDNGFITKGDANNTKDVLPVLEEEVIGKVIGHYPKLGKFSSWVKQEGWIYIASVLAILAIGGFIIKTVNDDEQSIESNSETNE